MTVYYDVQFSINNVISKIMLHLVAVCITSHKHIKHITGFPPISEIRENFEDFSQSGKSGENRGFSAKIREKISNQGTFFQTIFKPFQPINLRKLFLKSVKPQEPSGNCN